MDPHSARTVRDAIAELRAARRTVLLTTHNLTEAEELADRIMVIRDGLVVAEGTRDQLTRQLLGEPIWELRLAGPAHDIAQLLGDIVRVEASGVDWVRYRCTDARAINPQIIARLAAHGCAGDRADRAAAQPGRCLPEHRGREECRSRLVEQGEWGLGIRDWETGEAELSTQSPISNLQSPTRGGAAMSISPIRTITQREISDTLTDWRILVPMFILSFVLPEC